ncbi:glycosyltransferase family 2 protein [Microbacterium invictum]|uniref:Glycosyltransferase family 2 protein n=1 Tax=Microbacterium invictum TaxID=515415 RepID=A0ABZ0V798_9MICO|nr:glycosyltransferase family 2 protein [Microbacterium invictum]WQB69488.1 glycosyltransferase family 2 protein [Microbacterium invictum]
MSRVSVVIRTKDRPWFLARALKDVASQRFPVDVVVVNDGGDATTVESVVAGSPMDGRARVIHLPAGEGGRCRAANTGIAASRAEFVVLHDDDDLWRDGFLASSVQWLDEHPDDIGVMCRTEIRYEKLVNGTWTTVGIAPFWPELARISLSEMLEVNRAVPISFLYRRSVHDEVGGYDETLDAVEDWEFTLRVLSRHTIGFIPDVLAIWTQRPSAAGAEANSMFALSAEHRRDDSLVRDRELREWVVREGPGLPLMIAGEFARLRVELEATIIRELSRYSPIMALGRRGVRAWKRRRGTRE